MLLRNLFEFIVASPVVTASTVVSLSCASILVVKVAANDSSEMESSISAGSVSISSSIMQHSEAEQNSSFIDNNVNEYINDTYQNSSVNSNASAGSSGTRRNNHKKSQSNIKLANVNHNYYGTGSTSLAFEEPSNSAEYNDPAFSFYSGGANSVNSSTTTNTTNITSPDSSNTDNDSVPREKVDNPVTPDDTVLSEGACSVPLTHEVQIDLDETQYISCCPVVASGPPCLCTFTREDASGSSSQVVNSCS